MNTYTSGSLVRETGTFYDITGAPADPTTITLKYKAGGGTVTSLTYIGGDLTREAAGVYHYDFDTSGWTGPDTQRWVLEWIGTDAVQAITGDTFDVTPPAL